MVFSEELHKRLNVHCDQPITGRPVILTLEIVIKGCPVFTIRKEDLFKRFYSTLESHIGVYYH